MLVNIFDGVWHDGFVELDSGLTTEKNDYWVNSVYSNLIHIKKNTNYIYGFDCNDIPTDYRARRYDMQGAYIGSLTNQEFNPSQSPTDYYVRMLYHLGIN